MQSEWVFRLPQSSCRVSRGRRYFRCEYRMLELLAGVEQAAHRLRNRGLLSRYWVDGQPGRILERGGESDRFWSVESYNSAQGNSAVVLDRCGHEFDCRGGDRGDWDISVREKRLSHRSCSKLDRQRERTDRFVARRRRAMEASAVCRHGQWHVFILWAPISD